MTTHQHDLIEMLKVSLINIHFIMPSNAINKFSGAGDHKHSASKNKFNTRTFLSSGNSSVDVQRCKQSI